MKFYDLSKEEREQKYAVIYNDIRLDLEQGKECTVHKYFDAKDTYIRKAAYSALGKINKSDKAIRDNTIRTLERLIVDESERVRQSVIYSCGEIAVLDFAAVEHLLEMGLSDRHDSVRNAVIGSLKKSSQKNPVPTIDFCRKYILSPDAEIRRQACHGLELRGRTHPQDIMDTLKLLQHENTKRVRDMLIHVFGQISYKKGCFYYVIGQLKTWDNKDLYPLVQEEIIEVHGRYEKFSEFTQSEVAEYFARENQRQSFNG